MCGIVGIFDVREQREISEPVLRAMNESQHHRGPDESGLHLEPGVGLGHKRLSIIDLTTGKQPLYNEDKSVVVVYNGEIYNFQSLRKRLESSGHIFQTQTDTEVVVHAWEEWGADCVQEFRGMFAFAIWDRNRQMLFLARDRLGIKPLYYATLPDGQLIFSSEMKALLKHPDLERRIDPLAMEEYFALGYVPEPRSILKSISKLSSGYSLAIERGKGIPTPVQYWDVDFCSPVAIAEQDAVDTLYETFADVVRMRMVADVPVGAFLSGGVDSSGVVAMMAKSSSQPINTCSISFGDPDFNESTYAENMAQRLSTNHFVEQVDPDDFSLLDKLALIYDEPFADSSALPTYKVCQLARKHVKVALSGDGGDEVFAGYRRYWWHMLEEPFRRLLPDMVRRPVFSFLGRFYPKADWAPQVFRAKTTFQAIARDDIEAYFHSVSQSTDEMRKSLFSAKMRADLQGYEAHELFASHAKAVEGADPLAVVQYLDFKTYLVGDILTKVDRASMANSLEVRVPLLDHKLIEWAATLPRDLKMKHKDGKHVLKKALEQDVPKDILYRKKMGFAVPISNWFRTDLRDHVRERLLKGSLPETGLFQMDYVAQLIARHQSGVSDFSSILWALLIFESFYRQVLNEPESAAA